MSHRQWKARERATARALGTARIPNSGRGQPDMVAGGFAVEHKSREALPKWLTGAVEQVRRNAGEGQSPLVIVSMHRPGRRPLRLAVMELDEWIANFGRPGEEGGGP